MKNEFDPRARFSNENACDFSNDEEDDIHFAHRNRMRKAAAIDPELNGFRDVELLELFSSFFVPRRDTNPAAHTLLSEFGSVIDVLRTPMEKLAAVRGIPKTMARAIPALSATVALRTGAPVLLKDHFAAADFFGSDYLSGDNDGTFVACMNGGGLVNGIERCSAKDGLISIRAVFCAAARYNARKVVLARREKGFFPDVISPIAPLKKLACLLSETGVRLVDFFLFSDCGYYSLGVVPTDKRNWSPRFAFVPTKEYARSPELLTELLDSDLREIAATDGRIE